MAKKIQTILVSDLSGDEVTLGGETIEFSYRGVDYSIDLTDKEAQGFDKAVAKYLENATKMSGRRSTKRTGTKPSSKADLQAIREWARANGHEVSDRGRIPQMVQDAYNAAH